MSNRLFHKIFLTAALSITLGIVLVMALLSVSVSSTLAKEKEQTLTDNCKTISKVLSNQTSDSNKFYISLNGIMRVVSDATLGEAYVTDAHGHVFLCSCDEFNEYNACLHSNGVISEKIRNEAKTGSYFEIGNLNDRLQNIYYTAATPFYAFDGSIAGYVFISSPASQLNEMWSRISKAFIFCAIIPILLTFIFLYFMIKKIIKPIKLMSKAAVSMSVGNFSNRIPVSGNDEISDLAAAFNTMSNSLSQLEGMRRSFIANVSHELRTPMTTIGGFIDGILDGTIPPEKHEYYLSIVSTEVGRLSRLVRTMLSLAQLESGEQKVNPTEFSPFDLICEVLSSQEKRIVDKNLDIKGLENCGDIKMFADRDLIYQAIFNLTDNAIKFTPQDGYIEYNVTVDANNMLHISIKNTGKGIEPNELQFIFDRFYKTDKSRSANKDGTGLGLYIVKTVVDIHKGNITVSSKVDEYTEFEMVIPQTLVI